MEVWRIHFCSQLEEEKHIEADQHDSCARVPPGEKNGAAAGGTHCEAGRDERWLGRALMDWLIDDDGRKRKLRKPYKFLIRYGLKYKH